MTKQELVENIKRKQSFLCVGLDVDLYKIPKFLFDFEDPIFLNLTSALLMQQRIIRLPINRISLFMNAMEVKGGMR